MRPRPLGVIVAGGASRRYGARKAFARVGGERIIDRVRRALEAAGLRAVVVANSAEPYRALGLPVRGDAGPPLGPLAGVRTALLWAREEGAPGAVVVACDLPFVTAELVRRLVAAAAPRGADPGADAVLPESPGPRGVEPLCAYYSVACLTAVEAALERGRLTAVSFLSEVRMRTISRAELERLGGADTLFLNVNTPADRERAERIAAALPARWSPERHRQRP